MSDDGLYYSDIVTIAEVAAKIREALKKIQPNLRKYTVGISLARAGKFSEVKPGQTFFCNGAQFVKLPPVVTSSIDQVKNAIVTHNGSFCTFNDDDNVFIPEDQG